MKRYMLWLIGGSVLPCLLGGPAAATPFVDVPFGGIGDAYLHLSDLADEGILEGYPDGTYRGRQPVTREEFAQMLIRLVDRLAVVYYRHAVVDGATPFRDVSLDHRCASVLAKLAALGCVRGYPDGTFRGGQALTRHEAAWSLARLEQQLRRAQIVSGTTYQDPWFRLTVRRSPSFTMRDVSESEWAENAVESLNRAGVIEGYPDGQFYGEQPLTRYEAATALGRFQERVWECAGRPKRVYVSEQGR